MHTDHCSPKPSARQPRHVQPQTYGIGYSLQLQNNYHYDTIVALVINPYEMADQSAIQTKLLKNELYVTISVPAGSFL